MTIRQLKNWFHFFIAFVAAVWYRFPARQLTVIGVTGTDGKTTTTHLIHHILKKSGKKASMVSSIYAEIAGKQYDTGFHVTTPDSWMLQKFLRQAANAHEEYMVLEVTSHGLDQNRVWGIHFAIGVLTNVTHEHLDYHGTYDMYLRTKEKLLQKANVAIVNRDDLSFEKLAFPTYKKMVTYGMEANADISAQKYPFTSPLPGEYNRYNCLAAISVVTELGVNKASISKALKTFTGIKGRFEEISTPFGFKVIIDFAHTPNALEKVLATVKHPKKGRLIHVFGSAGLRDHLKRPLMGEMSATYANISILTEEDYRTEDIKNIIEEIAQGALKKGAVEDKSLFRIPDRQQAINFAIVKLAKKGDTVILTGKAHEKSLCRGTIEYPWNEHEAVKSALNLRRTGEGITQ